MFHVFYDIFNIILNTWHRTRTILEFKFIIPRWSYYELFELFQFNLCDKLKTNLCGSFVMLFSIFMNILGSLMATIFCCKPFWGFYADTKDIVFPWFQFLICMNCFQLLLMLIILEVWLTVCLELKFLILFLL